MNEKMLYIILLILRYSYEVLDVVVIFSKDLTSSNRLRISAERPLIML